MEEKKKKNKTSAAQIRASMKYTREKCDRLSVTLPKGHRPAWEEAAARQGLTLSGWTIRALDAAAAQVLQGQQKPEPETGEASPGPAENQTGRQDKTPARQP